MGFGDNYRTVLTMVLGLSILSIVIKINFILYLAIIIGFLSLLSKKIMLFICKFQERLMKLVSETIFFTLVLIVYLLTVIPVGFIYKFMAKSGNKWRAFLDQNQSVFISRDKTFVLEDFKKQW